MEKKYTVMTFALQQALRSSVKQPITAVSELANGKATAKETFVLRLVQCHSVGCMTATRVSDTLI